MDGDPNAQAFPQGGTTYGQLLTGGQPLADFMNALHYGFSPDPQSSNGTMSPNSVASALFAMNSGGFASRGAPANGPGALGTGPGAFGGIAPVNPAARPPLRQPISPAPAPAPTATPPGAQAPAAGQPSAYEIEWDRLNAQPPKAVRRRAY